MCSKELFKDKLRAETWQPLYTHTATARLDYHNPLKVGRLFEAVQKVWHVSDLFLKDTILTFANWAKLSL